MAVTKARLEQRLSALDREAARLAARIEMLDNLPAEPELTDSGEPVVVIFKRSFIRDGQLYDYAAIKAGDGLWYTTGPKTPKGYAWGELVEWIFQNGHVDLWVATGFETA